MEQLLNYAVKIDTLIEEYDEWDKTVVTFELRKSLYNTYSSDTEDTNSVIAEIDTYLPHATSMREGCLKELSNMTGFNDIGTIRKFVVELKTILNVYSERISNDYINQKSLEDFTQEEFEKLANDLIGNLDE